MKTTQLHSYLLALLTTLLWSFPYVLTPIVLQDFSVSSLALIRCAVASAALGCFVIAKGLPVPPLAVFPWFILGGATGFAVYFMAFNRGTLLLNATMTCILVSSAPIIIALLAQYFYHETLKRKEWLAIAAAFGGVLVMTLWGGSIVLTEGVFWVLGAAFLASVFMVLQRSLSRQYPPLLTISYSYIAATLMLLPFLPATLEELGAASANGIVLAVSLGALPSALGYFSWIKAISLAERTSDVANFMFLTPFLAFLLDYLITGQLPGAGTYIGGSVILASLFFFTMSRKAG